MLKEFTIKEVEAIDPYGFIYKTTNNKNGKMYIGQKKLTNDWKTYLGSGSLLKIAVSKYGKDNFSRKIIYLAYSKEELNKLEIEFIKNNNAVGDSNYYNISNGGGGGYRLNRAVRNNIFRISSLSSKQENYFSKISNELFCSKEKSSILQKNNNDYKTLYILDFLYTNINRRNIIKFRLKDMITDCGFMCNSRKDESSNRFKDILCNFQANGIIKSDIDFKKIKINDNLTCSLEINLNNEFFILYDFEKDRILNQTTVSKIDNHKLFLYYTYLKCMISKNSINNSKSTAISFRQINEDLGIIDISINKYNDALVKLDMIRKDSAGLWYYKDDINKSLKESCNIYTLFTNEEESDHNLKEGIKYWKKLDTNQNRVFKGTREYENNNRKLNGELGSIIKKENLGTVTAEDIVRKGEILASTKPDEEKYKIMSILDANPNELLSHIFEVKNIDISEKYYDLEDSLGLMNGEDLAEGIKYEDYKWVMINYKENEHQKFIDYVVKKKTDVFDIIDNRTPAETKGRGLQNNKRKLIIEDTVNVTVSNEPDIFEDWFNVDECDNNNDLTDEEYQAKQECIELNHAQIPDEVLREIEEDMYNRNKENIFEMFL